MQKARTAIPDDLAATVMFASDRTCCVCRNPDRKTEIHHIDIDPSNNDFENLAVLCKDDHSEAHTKHAFARNLTPELVREYNRDWRAIVRARSAATIDPLVFEYQQQVLLEIGLAPHAWKNHYMALFPGHFQNLSSAQEGGDIWDTLLTYGVAKYSPKEWEKYLPLFDGGIAGVVDALQRLLVAHGIHVPVKIKLAILRAGSQLETERRAYMLLPEIIRFSPGGEDSLFAERFRSAVRSLSAFARAADVERRIVQKNV